MENSGHIEDWGLVEYEYSYNPELYRDSLWLQSKLAALIMELAAAPEEHKSKTGRLYFDERTGDLENKPAQLVLNIIQKFHQEVEAQGAEFIILRLPIYRDLSTLLILQRDFNKRDDWPKKKVKGK